MVVGSSPTVGAFLARHECDSGEFRAPALRHKGFSGILTRLRQLVIGNYVSSVGSIYGQATTGGSHLELENKFFKHFASPW